MFDSGISNIKMIHFQGETQITTRLPLDDYPCPQIITKQIIRKRSLYEHYFYNHDLRYRFCDFMDKL